MSTEEKLSQHEWVGKYRDILGRCACGLGEQYGITHTEWAQHVASLAGPAQLPDCIYCANPGMYTLAHAGKHFDIHGQEHLCVAGASLAGPATYRYDGPPCSPIVKPKSEKRLDYEDHCDQREIPAGASLAGTEPEPRSGLVDLSNERDRALSFKRVAKHMMECFLEGEAENDLRLKMAEEYLTERFAPMLERALEAEIAALREQRGTGMGVQVPFTRALTVVMTRDYAAQQAQADAHIAAMDEGQIITHASEGYFHRLRRRVAEHPELAEKIAVFYQDEHGKLREIGLGFKDELRWPVGFCQEAWAEESEIEAIRALKTSASSGTK